MRADWLSRPECRCQVREDRILALGELRGGYFLFEPLADGRLARWYPAEGDGLEVDLCRARLYSSAAEFREDVGAGAVAVSADEVASLAIEVDGALWVPAKRMQGLADPFVACECGCGCHATFQAPTADGAGGRCEPCLETCSMKPLSAALLDLETMGQIPSGAIVQIGAVLITDRSRSETAFFSNVTLGSSLEAGLEIDPATAAWWWEQDAAARTRLFDPAPIPLRRALELFSAWLRRWGVEEIWSHKGFDVPILEAAYRRVGIEPPYDHRATRDLRTLYSHFPEQLLSDLLGAKPADHIDHVSLHDARHHAKVAAELLGILDTALEPLFTKGRHE